MRSNHFSAFLVLLLIPILAGCTGLFSSVFGQDNPQLIAAVPRLYRLPLVDNGERFLLAQGFGGAFSHTGTSSYALDLAMPVGTPVRAARDGVVHRVKMGAVDNDLPLSMREANYISIRHADGQISVYAHLDTSAIAVGTRVRQGDVIARSGNTGYSTQPHLHFHVETNGTTIPFAFLDVADPYGIPRVGQFYPVP